MGQMAPISCCQSRLGLLADVFFVVGEGGLKGQKTAEWNISRMDVKQEAHMLSASMHNTYYRSCSVLDMEFVIWDDHGHYSTARF